MTMAHINEELLAGHLTGALEDDEATFVATHLDECEACTVRLVEVRSLLALLPETVEEMTPGASLKSGLLSRAASEQTAPVQIRPVQAGVRTRKWTVQVPALALAAALVLAAILGGAASTILSRDDSELPSGLIEAITGTDKSVILPMNGTDVAPNVRAALLAPLGEDRVFVLASNVPPAPAGQAYHLYLYEDGKPLKAAVLTPDSRGRISAVLDAPLARFDAMEVDIQAVGTTTPGGPAVLKSNLP